jgi:hypothetical protein
VEENYALNILPTQVVQSKQVNGFWWEKFFCLCLNTLKFLVCTFDC